SGGGGGSTGGGGTPPIPELKPELPKTENGSTTVTTPVQSESKGSSASATVSEKTVTSAIETAVKEAERTGTVAGVVIKVDAPAASKSVELSISKSSIAAVAKGKTESLKITSPVAEISLDSKALSAVAEATDKQVKITATCIEPASLTPVQSVKVGDVPVYDFTITDGKTEVSDFRGGSATVSLPYTLKDAEEGAYVTVWYLASDGSLRPVTAQYEAGRVTFTVGHFSRYAVGYLPFNDVETGWYYESVVYVYGSEILGGVGENSFAPDARMTRAMLLTALYRMSGEKSDVQGETWYANAVAWAVEKGISDGKQLDGEVTRAQLATMIYRYYFAMQTADGDLTSGQNAALAMPQDCTFADRESIAPWARDAAAWCGANGIITGRVGNHFGPDGMATRAEVALVLLRLSEKTQG
ncbi:MAG: S-layer homology domain-containing protein, partial [Oscillospiraceae bacterium]